jgi:hypothetical protein
MFNTLLFSLAVSKAPNADPMCSKSLRERDAWLSPVFCSLLQKI